MSIQLHNKVRALDVKAQAVTEDLVGLIEIMMDYQKRLEELEQEVSALKAKRGVGRPRKDNVSQD